MSETPVAAASADPTAGMSSREMLNYHLNKSYSDAREGKARGELVCWSSSIAPNEFCEAMGIHMLYPENHAAAVGARHGALELLDVAEKDGYSIDNCAYARINLAYMKTQKCVGESMPLPDFVIICNNICETLVKWYENLAHELHIPIIFIDVPYNYEYEPTPRSIEYISQQFTNAIKQLEEITGRAFDYDKFDAAMEMSIQSCYWWSTAMAMASAIPSPAKRVAGLVGRVGVRPAVAMSGGVALNQGIIAALEAELGVPVYVPEDCQLAGAIGAAVYACESLLKSGKAWPSLGCPTLGERVKK